MSSSITIQADNSKLIESLDEFKGLLKHSPSAFQKRIQRFFGARNSVAKLICVNSKDFGASGTSEFRISLEPSKLLLKFISAMRGAK